MNGWENAPEWVMCKTTDANGRTMFHNKLPVPDDLVEAWVHNQPGAIQTQDTSVCPSWRDSLEMRPGQKMSLPSHAPDWSKAGEREDWAVWMGKDWWYTQNLDLRVFKGHAVVARP
jgi:hypothetical protein